MKTREVLADELEVDLVEVTAHGGARPSHAKWQGQVFSRNGDIEIDGVKILLTHGHRYGVKNGYLNLIMRAKELQVNAVIFGHTHIPEVFTEDGVLFVNPGSCSYYAVKRTYAVMFIYKGKPSAVINEIV